MAILVRSVGASASFFELAVAVTISNLVAVLPISINGIGVLDGVYIFIMKDFGMEYELALMVMFLIRALVIPLSLAGGYFYLQDKSLYENTRMMGENIQSVQKTRK